MNFTVKASKNEISISKETMKALISLLDKVDCTCVWSEQDNQYIKIQDIPAELVDELILKMKFAD